MSEEREALARYQAKLLDILYRAETAKDAREAIQRIAIEAKLQDALGDVDDKMVDVAMHLTKKWGILRSGPAPHDR